MFSVSGSEKKRDLQSYIKKNIFLIQFTVTLNIYIYEILDIKSLQGDFHLLRQT